MARHCMNLTKPRVVFVCQSAVQTLREAARLENINPAFVVFGEDLNLSSLKDIMRLQTMKEVEKFQPEPAKSRNDIAMILFSSGTTGLPKGVALSYDTLLRLICGSSVMPTKSLNILWYSSLYWISGTLLMMQSLMNSATRIIHANSDPEETCKIIDKFKVVKLSLDKVFNGCALLLFFIYSQINSFFLTPSMVTHFCKSDLFKKYKLESVQAIFTGGAKVSKEILEEFKNKIPNATLTQGYGE